jgi:hypothetical protein
MLNRFLVGLLSWAGRSAWNDRSVGIAEAAGSNPAPSTTMSALSFLFVYLSSSSINGEKQMFFIFDYCLVLRLSSFYECTGYLQFLDIVNFLFHNRDI